MLFDPKWEAKTDNPLSLSSLILWLETKPADESYYYGSNDNCLICQFLKAHGISRPRAGGSYWRREGDCENLYNFGEDIEKVAVAGEHTFGEALSRARALLTD